MRHWWRRSELVAGHQELLFAQLGFVQLSRGVRPDPIPPVECLFCTALKLPLNGNHGQRSAANSPEVKRQKSPEFGFLD
jgi:hypothetical protein